MKAPLWWEVRRYPYRWFVDRGQDDPPFNDVDPMSLDGVNPREYVLPEEAIWLRGPVWLPGVTDATRGSTSNSPAQVRRHRRAARRRVDRPMRGVVVKKQRSTTTARRWPGRSTAARRVKMAFEEIRGYRLAKGDCRRSSCQLRTPRTWSGGRREERLGEFERAAPTLRQLADWRKGGELGKCHEIAGRPLREKILVRRDGLPLGGPVCLTRTVRPRGYVPPPGGAFQRHRSVVENRTGLTDVENGCRHENLPLNEDVRVLGGVPGCVAGGGDAVRQQPLRVLTFDTTARSSATPAPPCARVASRGRSSSTPAGARDRADHPVL